MEYLEDEFAGAYNFFEKDVETILKKSYKWKKQQIKDFMTTYDEKLFKYWIEMWTAREFTEKFVN